MIKFSPTAISAMISGYVGLTKISIFTGTIPTVDDAYVFNPSNYTASTVASFTVACNQSGYSVVLSATPAAINASITGSATWFALHNGSTTALLGSVGDMNSTAPLQLQTTDVVAGSPVNINQLVIKLAP